jgi:hypothetical protein
MKTIRDYINLIESAQTPVAEGSGPQSKLDQKIIHLLTNGIPADAIARKLDIPVEWVHEVAKYNMPDSDIDYNDPRNSTQGRERFGEQGVAEAGIDLDDIPGLKREPAKKQTRYHNTEPQDRIDLDSIPGLNLGGSAKSKTSTRLGGAKSTGIQAPDATKTRGIYNKFKDQVNQKLKQQGRPEIDDEQGVAEAIDRKDLISRLQKDLPRVDDPKNKDAEPIKWTGPKKGDYGHTGYQGHGMPTDRAERARIRADKNKAQDK